MQFGVVVPGLILVQLALLLSKELYLRESLLILTSPEPILPAQKPTGLPFEFSQPPSIIS